MSATRSPPDATLSAHAPLAPWLAPRHTPRQLRRHALLTRPLLEHDSHPAGGLFHLVDFAAFPHTLALPARRLMDSLTSQSALHAALGSSRRRAFHAELQRLVDAHFVPQEAQQLAQQLAAVGGRGTVQVRRLRSLVPGAARGGYDSFSCLAFLPLPRCRAHSAAPSCHSPQVAAPDTVQGRQCVAELPLLTKAYLLAKSPAPAPRPQPCGCGSARSAAGTAPFAPEHRCLFCGRTIDGE